MHDIKNATKNESNRNALSTANDHLRNAILIVACANLLYFFVEFIVAQHINATSLFADSVDFLEDAAVNCLIAIALGLSFKQRAYVGMVMAAFLLIPALSFLWAVWKKSIDFTPPDAGLLSVTGLGALVVNVSCAFLLVKFRHARGSLTHAAFLSARNDAVANSAIIVAGLITRVWPSAWPDLIAGIGIALMNADAAKAVWLAAREEHALAGDEDAIVKNALK